jgi:hypothetical protein
VQTNLQLLAACYLQSNQAYSAYHILKGTFLVIVIYFFDYFSSYVPINNITAY